MLDETDRPEKLRVELQLEIRDTYCSKSTQWQQKQSIESGVVGVCTGGVQGHCRGHLRWMFCEWSVDVWFARGWYRPGSRVWSRATLASLATHDPPLRIPHFTPFFLSPAALKVHVRFICLTSSHLRFQLFVLLPREPWAICSRSWESRDPVLPIPANLTLPFSPSHPTFLLCLSPD